MRKSRPTPPASAPLTPPPAHLVPIADAPLTSTAPAKNATHAATASAVPPVPPSTSAANPAPAAGTAAAISPLNTASLADPAQQQIARAKYQALHDQISSTRENLPGDDTTNRTLLRDRAEEAQDVLTTLDRNDLQTNTPAFTAAAAQIQQANADMEKLSDSIGGIIHNLQATADFVQIANEAISAATKFIA